ncbi:MAG: PQQ-binding-like beta-propeller repeat protein [Planctomycetota bacterium]
MSKQDIPEQTVQALGPTVYRTAVRIAIVAGAFSLIVVACLAVNEARSRSLNVVEQTEPLTAKERDLLARASQIAARQARYLDPSKAEERLSAREERILRGGRELADRRRLAVLKMKLQMNESDDELRQTIRAYDARLRARHEQRVRLAQTGGRLLLVGGAVFLTALLYAGAYRASRSIPEGKPPGKEAQQRTATFARWSVAGIAVVVLAVAFGGGLFRRAPAPPIPTPPQQDDPQDGQTPTPTVPAGDPAKNWPRFRGPGGLGVAHWTDMPVTWNGKTGAGIRWKTPVPLPGKNSPVVWQDRVFLSGATKQKREVYGFDADTGELLWQTPIEDVPGSPEKVPNVMDMTGYAAPTMTTDGARAYASFANGDLAALDYHGDVVWTRNLGLPDNRYGHASSLTMHKGLLIVQYDQGNMAEDGLSRVLGIDGASGDIAWENDDRPVRDSWTSPIIIDVDGKAQLVTAADPWVIAYDPGTGEEIWRARCLIDVDAGPSPTYADGLVFVCNDGTPLIGIRPTGTGDVTETHVAFKVGDYMPDTVSPVADGDIVWALSGTILSCYGVRENKMLWDHEFDEVFTASPTLVGDRVYLIDNLGKARIFRRSKAGYKELAAPPLGEKVRASPAFVRGRIYVRGEKHLYCIERPTE